MKTINNDTAATVDFLDRDKFAKHIVISLSESFQNLEHSFVVGICGEWGSGKTSLLKFIEREINLLHNNGDDYKTIHFNPWEMQGQDEIQRKLLETIIKSIGSVKWKKNIKKTDETIKKYLKYLEVVKFLKVVHPIAKNILTAADDYVKKMPIHSIEEMRNDINELIRENGLRLYVFIDDLDRLDPEEITAVFKTIKLNVNFANTIFLIAYDKAVVIRSLSNQFKTGAASYLEKIIQVDFNIPEILEEKMEDFFFKQLEQYFLAIKVGFDRRLLFKIWKHHGLSEYFYTLRDIKRFFNSLAFSFPPIKEDVDTGDFIALEAIKVFDFDAYEALYSRFIEMRRKARWSREIGPIKPDSLTSNKVTESLLEYLLPQNNIQPGGPSLNKKRLHDPAFFPRYYSLHISTKDVQEQLLIDFLTKNSNKDAILEDVFVQGKIENFLRRLGDDKINKYIIADDPLIFTSLVKFWDAKPDSITRDIFSYLWNAYFNLINAFKDSYSAAKTGLENLIMNPNDFQHLRLIFNHAIFELRENGRNEPLFSEDTVQQLDLISGKMMEGFVKNIMDNGPSYIHSATQMNNNFLWGELITSFGKYNPNYQILLDLYMKSTAFLNFAVKAKFVRVDTSTNLPFAVDLSARDVLFPASNFNHFIENLKALKKGDIKKEDQLLVDFFLEHLREIK